MTAIAVRGIRKRYGDVQAVDGISFAVDRSEIFGMLGPNGAGKTTTLEIIEGLREPDDGDVEVLGLKPWPRNPSLLPRIGVQLQATAFFDNLTAREQIRLFAALYDAPPERADAALELVGLDAREGTLVEKLSGGQRQRLSIACALAHDPEVVFLDEPTAALDPQSRRNFWDVIRGIRDAGKTIVLTTHHMDEAEELCDRVAIIDAGRILALDTPETLVRALDAPTRVSFARDALAREAVEALPGAFDIHEDEDGFVLYTLDAAATISRLAAAGGLRGVQVRGATLEDVFLRLTGREYRE